MTFLTYQRTPTGDVCVRIMRGDVVAGEATDPDARRAEWYACVDALTRGEFEAAWDHLWALPAEEERLVLLMWQRLNGGVR